MSSTDLLYLLQWYGMLLAVGLLFFPLTSKIFPQFPDRGYGLTKTLGLLLTTYIVFILSMTRIVQFNIVTIILTIAVLSTILLFLSVNPLYQTKKRFGVFLKNNLGLILFEEIIFFVALYFMTYVRAFSPDIHGLEKYMDYGFINSILRADYFPPKDMWFTPLSINYYYFGHLSTALLTKLSGLGSEITYNLMIASIFALTLAGGFSLTSAFISSLTKNLWRIRIFFSLLSALILTLGGNLHTIYTFFSPYSNESPVPPWQLVFQPLDFPNQYWYPNATRFIYNTIHEFPMYSWTVSDLHGHVLDIPYVLLTIGVIYAFFLFVSKTESISATLFRRKKIKFLLFIGLLLSVMYMTNAWDGIIYFLLAIAVVFVSEWIIRHDKMQRDKSLVPKFFERIKHHHLSTTTSVLLASFLSIFIVAIGFVIFSLPFSMAFKPFVSGIGVLCAPEFLTNLEKFGPFLFEKDHCQHSPIWQLIILHGFFYFFVFLYVFLLWKIKKLTKTDIFVCILLILSTILILIPEFIYAKDIYPGHYRANTMFKLVFQSFIMFSICIGYILFRFLFFIHVSKKKITLFSMLTVILSLFLLTLIFIYPFQAIHSYYSELKTYYGLDGTAYLSRLYPNDYKAILWLEENVQGQPIILEAQGDSYGGASSYTDYARVSANTGLPTVLGWTVHEWLWRGSYDIPAPRVEEIRLMYESENLEEKIRLFQNYDIAYIFVGQLEREKYPYLNEIDFEKVADRIYSSGQTNIYKLH